MDRAYLPYGYYGEGYPGYYPGNYDGGYYPGYYPGYCTPFNRLVLPLIELTALALLLSYCLGEGPSASSDPLLQTGLLLRPRCI